MTEDETSKRIETLSAFVIRFAPALGECRDAHARLVDDDTPTNVVNARDDAILAAFEAIERLAARS